MTLTREAKTLTLDGGLAVFEAAIAGAERIGQPMCIAVVDAGGNLLAFGRMDGARGLSVTSSINKARTAALSGDPTGSATADVEMQVMTTASAAAALTHRQASAAAASRDAVEIAGSFSRFLDDRFRRPHLPIAPGRAAGSPAAVNFL